MYFGKDTVSEILQFCGKDLKGSEPETVLEIEIDNKLNLESH